MSDPAPGTENESPDGIKAVEATNGYVKVAPEKSHAGLEAIGVGVGVGVGAGVGVGVGVGAGVGVGVTATGGDVVEESPSSPPHPAVRVIKPAAATPAKSFFMSAPNNRFPPI